MNTITLKTRLHELVEELPDSELYVVERFLESIKTRLGTPEDLPIPREVLATFGSWKDEHDTEEIIREIYDSRTVSDRDIHL